MGNFYKNVTVIGSGQSQVVEALGRHGRIAYVTPTRGNVTVVFDRESDAAGNPAEVGDLALTLSADLSCVTVAAAVYDDDVLLVALYDKGAQLGEYNSSAASSLTPRVFARALGVQGPRVFLLWLLLRAPRLPLFLFETWRHFLLMRVLRMPAWAGATGYKYILQGEPPPDLQAAELAHVGEVRPWSTGR